MWTKILCFLLLLMVPLSASSIAYFKPTKSERNLLPAYCGPRATTWGDNREDPRTKRWFRLFGQDYKHMHHYCEGLVQIIRGDRSVRNPREAGSHYESSIKEFAYMERAVLPGFKLWPELLVKKGDAYNRLGDSVHAENYYRKAFSKYPKYSVSYKRLVDLYIKMKRYKEAKEINEAALNRFGNKKGFLRRKKKLDRLIGKQ